LVYHKIVRDIGQGGIIMWYMHGGWGGWMIFGGIFMLLFWGGIIALIVWAINRLVRHGGGGSKQTPLDIAKERYARGEITREQFEQIKKDL
jgi:putative membrane protein